MARRLLAVQRRGHRATPMALLLLLLGGSPHLPHLFGREGCTIDKVIRHIGITSDGPVCFRERDAKAVVSAKGSSDCRWAAAAACD